MSATAEQTRRPGPARRVADWFTPATALARIAWLRTILYLFVIVDLHAFVRDTRLKGEHPGLYQPLLLARLFADELALELGVGLEPIEQELGHRFVRRRKRSSTEATAAT